MRVVKAKAPCRICDIGGWTDTRFAEHGAVFSIAVWPGVEVTIYERPNSTGQFFDGLFPRVVAAAACKLMDVTGPVNITYAFEMMRGSGTGTSAAHGVALIAALDKWRGGNLNKYEIAQMAHRIETEELGLECGVQDQFASACGGVNLIQIDQYPDLVAVKPLPIRRTLLKRLMLVDIGVPHNSSDVHKKVIERIEGPGDNSLEALRDFAECAESAYLADDMAYFGQLMRWNTNVQRELHPCTTEVFEPLIKGLMDIGVPGWKVNGAGGGGTITIMAEGVKNRSAIEALIETDYPECRIIPITVAEEGVEVWENMATDRPGAERFAIPEEDV